MLYSYSFQNKKRDLSDVLSTVIKDEPRFMKAISPKRLFLVVKANPCTWKAAVASFRRPPIPISTPKQRADSSSSGWMNPANKPAEYWQCKGNPTPSKD